MVLVQFSEKTGSRKTGSRKKATPSRKGRSTTRAVAKKSTEKKEKKEVRLWIVCYKNGFRKIIGQKGKLFDDAYSQPFASNTPAARYAKVYKSDWDDAYFKISENPKQFPPKRPSAWGRGYKLPRK